jgi:hypothetical protein
MNTGADFKISPPLHCPARTAVLFVKASGLQFRMIRTALLEIDVSVYSHTSRLDEKAKLSYTGVATTCISLHCSGMT